MNNFSDTTCNLAKKFFCYVFEAMDDAQVILLIANNLKQPSIDSVFRRNQFCKVLLRGLTVLTGRYDHYVSKLQL